MFTGIVEAVGTIKQVTIVKDTQKMVCVWILRLVV